MSKMYGVKGKWLLMLVLTIVMVTAACSNGNANNSGQSTGGSKTKEESGTQTGGTSGEEKDPYDGLPKKISVSMFDRGAVSSDEGTYEENRWVTWIREQSGIDVSFVPIPRSQAQDTLNVLIASGQSPDLIWEFDRSYIGRLVSQGVLQPVGDYIEKYSTVYKEYLEKNPDLLSYLTFNGEIYALTTKRDLNSVANHGIWIRQDWLDELQLEMPQTIEELLEVARAMKERDPGSTPIVGYTNFDVYASMYAAHHSQWYVEDGQMVYGSTLDRFGDVIALEKQLYEEGLVDTEYLTDANNQRANQLWTTGKAGIFFAQWGGGSIDPLNRNLLENDPTAQPAPMPTVETPYGRFGAYQEAPPNLYIAFHKDMKNPKAAIEYLDWILSEGWFTLVNGEEGVHYEMVDGVAKRLDADKFTKEVGYASEYAVLRGSYFKPENLIVSAAEDELSQRLAHLSAESLEVAMKYPYRRDTPYQPTFDEINEIRATFDTFIRETRANAVMQGSKYTAEWAMEEIHNEWKRLGGEKAQEIAQQWYEDNKADF